MRSVSNTKKMAVALGIPGVTALTVCWVAACGGRIEAPLEEAEAGKPVGAEARRRECLAECAETYPRGLTTTSAIDACLAERCDVPCSGPAADGSRVPYDAGKVDRDNFADAGSHVCGTSAITGLRACDTCSEAFCCREIVACYVTFEGKCVAYQKCASRCPRST